MTIIEELSQKAIEIATDPERTPENKLQAIGYLFKGEVDDILKVTHNIRKTSLPGEMVKRLHELEVNHGIYSMKQYMME